MGLFQTQLPPNFGGPYTIRRHPLGTTGGRKAARELSSTANSKPLPQTLPAHIRTSLSSSLSLMMEVTLPLQPWPSSLRQLLEGSQPSARHPTVGGHILLVLHKKGCHLSARSFRFKQALVLKLSCSPLSNRGQCWEHLGSHPHHRAVMA